MEQRAIVGFSKVDLSFASLDVLKFDFVLQVYATDGGWRYLLFTKLSMKHLCTLNKWQVSGVSKCRWWNQVANVLLC